MALICTSLVTVKFSSFPVFIGHLFTAEAEAPILWPPDAKNWLIGKDPDAGKDWRQEEKGMREDEMVGWHHQLHWTWVWASSRSWWWTGKPGVLQSMGSQRVGHDWVTELNCLLPSWSTSARSCSFFCWVDQPFLFDLEIFFNYGYVFIYYNICICYTCMCLINIFVYSVGYLSLFLMVFDE